VLAVETVGDVSVRVYLVNNPVCVVLHSGSKDDYFIEFLHFIQKFGDSGSN